MIQLLINQWLNQLMFKLQQKRVGLLSFPWSSVFIDSAHLILTSQSSSGYYQSEHVNHLTCTLEELHLQMLMENRSLRFGASADVNTYWSEIRETNLWCAFAGFLLVFWFFSSPACVSQMQIMIPDPTSSWWWWMIWALEISAAMEMTPSGKWSCTE